MLSADFVAIYVVSASLCADFVTIYVVSASLGADFVANYMVSASLAADFLARGKEIALEGKLTNRSYEDKEGNKKYISEVLANQILILDKKS